MCFTVFCGFCFIPASAWAAEKHWRKQWSPQASAHCEGVHRLSSAVPLYSDASSTPSLSVDDLIPGSRRNRSHPKGGQRPQLETSPQPQLRPLLLLLWLCGLQSQARGLDLTSSLLSPTGSFPAGPVCPLHSGTPRQKTPLKFNRGGFRPDTCEQQACSLALKWYSPQKDSGN